MLVFSRLDFLKTVAIIPLSDSARNGRKNRKSSQSRDEREFLVPGTDLLQQRAVVLRIIKTRILHLHNSPILISASVYVNSGEHKNKSSYQHNKGLLTTVVRAMRFSIKDSC